MSAATNSPKEVRTNSLFTHLNRDIRNIIYDVHLVHPLLSDDVAGLMLSCRTAKEEVEEAAVRNMKIFLNSIKAHCKTITGHDIIFSLPQRDKQGLANIRHLEIEVPYNLL
ncbi:hypothetical protein K491DRAFT_683579 [Lophiostoma macrostomum CBS 122681]|uniref:Uncharacterized protein n=1 Tax=Lophiostoma macrostomum CBS 122681 TaxID=1314788 RepID=A0A6A6STI6_9PLEO|nr:hypothetical protein K491DRAFT_683579 [Lophiostoma macrostomum CBS 122681]